MCSGVLNVIDMRLRPIHLTVIPLAAVAIALACDTPVIPPAAGPTGDAPTAPAPAPNHASLELVGPAGQSVAGHSALGLKEHVALHVGQARRIEEDSDARLLAAFRGAGASEEQLKRWRLEMEESRSRDAKHLQALLTDILER